VERREVWRSVATDFPRDAADAMVAGEVGLDGIEGALEDLAAAKVRGRVLVDPRR